MNKLITLTCFYNSVREIIGIMNKIQNYTIEKYIVNLNGK